jgi:hypothetical protein
MSLELTLYLYRNLDQAPGLALNAVAPYTQGIGYVKTKTAHFLNTCKNQLQNTFNVVYPILRHPRNSTISAVLFSTKYMANLTGMACIYQKICHVLSRRVGRVASIENQLLVNLKNLSNYCIQLNTSYIPWQKIPGLHALEELKEELVNKQQVAPSSEQIAEAISCCNEIHALVTLHRSISSTEDLNPEEIRAIEENTDTIFSAVEENIGEALGGYTPSILAPVFNDLLNSVPESYNPFALASNSLLTTLKKILATVGSSSTLTITSSNYFVSSNAQKALLQLTAISGMSAAGLYYQEQMEEVAKEVLQTFLEITCAYAGMLLFKTDESFKDYFHKIVPATIASKATEHYLDSRESFAITSFALPLVVSSLVYNQASIQETYQQLNRLFINISNSEEQKQLLQPITSFIKDQLIHRFSNALSLIALQKTIENISSSPALAYAVLWADPVINDHLLKNILIPLFSSINQQILDQSIEQKILQVLSASKEYLTILQQDDMQKLLLKIQHDLHRKNPDIEELKNQFLEKVFLKKTGMPLPLGNPTLDLLKQSFGLDIQAVLFTSFKHTPPAIRMLWNSYSYHKKVDQALMLELLLQGFIINGLANLIPGSNTELPSFSYVKTAGLGISLAL